MAYIDPRTLVGASFDIYARKSKKLRGDRQSESTRQQIAGCEQDGERFELTRRHVFADDGISASRFATGVRLGYRQVLDQLRVDPPRVLALWEQSRSTRDAAVGVELLDLLRDQHVLVMIRGRLRDPRDPEDRKALIEGVAAAEYESAITSERTLRDVRAAALEGKPHGQAPYGYERRYDPYTRALVEQVPHPEQAPIVREIVRRVLAGESARSIAADLTRREIRRPYGGTTWHPAEIKDICLRPAYRGLREHTYTALGEDGKSRVQTDLIPAIWAEHRLITEEDAEQLDAVFARRSTQKGLHSTSAKHLLAGVAWCGRCDKAMYKDRSNGQQPKDGAVRFAYHCTCGRQRDAVHLESWAREAVNELLADSRLAQALYAPEVDVAALQKKLDAVNAELEEGYEAGLSARGLASLEARLLPLQAEFETLIREAVGGATDVGVALEAERLPEDDLQARELLLRLRLHVVCDAAKRGRYFDYDSIRLERAS